MAGTTNILNEVKTGIFNLLESSPALEWANSRSLMEVPEFGVPTRRWQKSLQLLLSADVAGQSGGSFIVSVRASVAAVARLSRDTEGRYDRILEETRKVLSDIQNVLEGQSFNFLEVPLYTDVGPTQPEFFETEPAFAFSYLEMSGTKYQPLYEALGFNSWGEWNQGYQGG